MTNNPAIGFGDVVRIKRTPVTEAAQLAGLCGHVFGETTPSIGNVQVIGQNDADFALMVTLDERDESHWFAPDLLELVDHGAGSEITLDGVSGKLVRTETGEWKATGADPETRSMLAALFGPFKRKKK